MVLLPVSWLLASLANPCSSASFWTGPSLDGHMEFSLKIKVLTLLKLWESYREASRRLSRACPGRCVHPSLYFSLILTAKNLGPWLYKLYSIQFKESLSWEAPTRYISSGAQALGDYYGLPECFICLCGHLVCTWVGSGFEGTRVKCIHGHSSVSKGQVVALLFNAHAKAES